MRTWVGRNVITLEKFDHVRGKCPPVRRCHAVAEDGETVVRGAERPAAEAQNLFHAFEVCRFQLVELVPDTAHIDLEILCDGGKGEVDVRIRRGVELRNVHVEALALSSVPPLEVADAEEEPGGLLVVDDIGQAVGDAAVGAGPCRARRPRVGRRHGAEVRGGATHAPDIAACIQGTGIELGDVCPVRRPLGADHLGTAGRKVIVSLM